MGQCLSWEMELVLKVGLGKSEKSDSESRKS